VREHLLQDGALNAGATDDLLIDLPAAGLPERVTLEGKALFLRAHPGVSDLHAGSLRVRQSRCVSPHNSNQFLGLRKHARQGGKNQGEMPVDPP
jgi:hypothetical protein